MLNISFLRVPIAVLPTRVRVALLFFILAGSVVFSRGALCAEETAGKQWPASQQLSMDNIDHQVFDGLLKKYVDTNGMVNYRAWHASTSDRDLLTKYLAHLSQASSSKPAVRNAKLAFWINAYNAVTIEGILRVYPTKSIRKHTAKLLGYNIWKDLKLHVGNGKINLEDIEHKVLRKMNEPRIHFAVVCASIGCPRLLNEAYVTDKVEQQLDVNSKDFFSRSQNLQIDVNTKTIKLSKLLEWYGSDFGSDLNGQLVAYQKHWPAASLQSTIAGGFRVSYLPYDWNLNAQQ